MMARRPRWLGVLLFAVVVATACSSEAGSRYASCIDLSEVEAPELPSAVTLPEELEVTEIVEEKGYVAINAVGDSTVQDVFQPLERALIGAGFEVINRDFEGFEAEIFFADTTEAAGVARLRTGPCPDQVMLSMLYDPVDSPGGKRALKQARKEAFRNSRPLASPSP